MNNLQYCVLHRAEPHAHHPNMHTHSHGSRSLTLALGGFECAQLFTLSNHEPNIIVSPFHKWLCTLQECTYMSNAHRTYVSCPIRHVHFHSHFHNVLQNVWISHITFGILANVRERGDFVVAADDAASTVSVIYDLQFSSKLLLHRYSTGAWCARFPFFPDRIFHRGMPLELSDSIFGTCSL